MFGTLERASVFALSLVDSMHKSNAMPSCVSASLFCHNVVLKRVPLSHMQALEDGVDYGQIYLSIRQVGGLRFVSSND